MASLNDVVQFAAQGPTLVVRWIPSVDYYTDTTPVFAVKAAGDVLAWFPAFSSNAIGDRVRQVVQLTPTSWRVDFVSRHDVSAVFRRPTSEDEKKRGFDWLEQVREGGSIDMGARVDLTLQLLGARAPLPARDKIFPVAYWSEYDFRVEKSVPAGVVVPSDDNRSLQWVPLPGWEEAADERNRSSSFQVENPVEAMVYLAERPGQNRSVSFPEYVRAADPQDAAELALRKQWENLIGLVGVPES